MENHPMNHTSSRACHIRTRQPQGRQGCGCSCGGDRFEDGDIYAHADRLPLAMAYVPMQSFGTTFPLCKGFQLGTIFPELCKPFCGRRCVNR